MPLRATLCVFAVTRFATKVRPVPPSLNDLRYELALASRMLANEGVLDAFGHVSLRHPTDSDRYLLPRSRSPQLIEPAAAEHAAGEANRAAPAAPAKARKKNADERQSSLF